MPRPWGEHVLLSLLADHWDSEPSHGVCRLCLWKRTREFLLPPFERILKTRQAGTKERYQKAIPEEMSLSDKKPNRQTMGNMMGMPPAVEVLKVYP